MTESDTCEVMCTPPAPPFISAERIQTPESVCKLTGMQRAFNRELFSDWWAHLINEQSQRIHCRQLGAEGSIPKTIARRHVFTFPSSGKADLIG